MTARRPVTALVVNYEIVSSLLRLLRENLFGDAGYNPQEVKRLVGRLTVEIEGPRSQLAKSPLLARQADPPEVAPPPIRTYRVRDLSDLLHLHYRTIQRMLREKLQDGDLLITLGAGDVWKIGEELLEQESGFRH